MNKIRISTDLTLSLSLCSRARMPAIETAVSSVICLFFRRSPSTVIGGVRTIVVRETIYRVYFGRALTHVCKKHFKAVFPSITHCDSASAIFRVVWMVLIEAPTFEAFPRPVLNRKRHQMRASTFTNSLKAKTTARSALLAKMILPDNNCCPAVATACPRSVAWRRTHRFMNNSKTSESFAGQVWCASHAPILHKNGLLAGNN